MPLKGTNVLKIIVAAACSLGACAAPKADPAPVTTPPQEVVVWEGQPVPNLTPPQTLTILGSTEADCADMGGTWVYEACEDVDY